MNKRLLFFLSGGVVLLIVLLLVGFFVVAPAITSANSTQSATPTVTATTPPSTPTTSSKKGQYVKVLKKNKTQILNQIAQGLHLTPAQLQSDLKAGQSLSQIATTQKVSATQLQTIEGSAITSSLQSAVSSGTLTQKQATNLAKHLVKKPQILERLLKA